MKEMSNIHVFLIILYGFSKQYLLLTAIIIIALSKSPNPINGTALWKATVRINHKINMEDITKHTCI